MHFPFIPPTKCNSPSILQMLKEVYEHKFKDYEPKCLTCTLFDHVINRGQFDNLWKSYLTWGQSWIVLLITGFSSMTLIPSYELFPVTRPLSCECMPLATTEKRREDHYQSTHQTMKVIRQRQMVLIYSDKSAKYQSEEGLMSHRRIERNHRIKHCKCPSKFYVVGRESKN